MTPLALAKRIADDNITNGSYGGIDFLDGEPPHQLDADSVEELAKAFVLLHDAIDELLADWRRVDPIAQDNLIYQRAQHALSVATDAIGVIQ